VDSKRQRQNAQAGGGDNSPQTVCGLGKLPIFPDRVITERDSEDQLERTRNFKPELMNGLQKIAENQFEVAGHYEHQSSYSKGHKLRIDRMKPISVRWEGTKKQEARLQIDDRLKGLLKELGDAINLALSQSVEINEAIQNVRNAGYEVVLALEATIGFNKKVIEETSSPASESPAPDGNLKVTSQDLKFLQELKISVEDFGDR